MDVFSDVGRDVCDLARLHGEVFLTISFGISTYDKYIADTDLSIEATKARMKEDCYRNSVKYKLHGLASNKGMHRSARSSPRMVPSVPLARPVMPDVRRRKLSLWWRTQNEKES